MPPETIASNDEFGTIRAFAGYNIVMFTSSSCPPCKTIYPVYEEFALKAHPDRLKCYTLDVSVIPSAADDEKILGIPTFVLYNAGEKLISFAGADREALTNMFRRTVDVRDVLAAPSFLIATGDKTVRRLST